MKNTILFLSAIGCLVLPVISHADTPAAKKKVSLATATAMMKPSSTRTIYYIGTESRAGSHIPMVSRSYGGRIDSASSPAVYGSTAIRDTGALDVSTALYKLDPSISIGRGR